jgi:hypothetical protein
MGLSSLIFVCDKKITKHLIFARQFIVAASMADTAKAQAPRGALLHLLLLASVQIAACTIELWEKFGL